MKATRHVDRIKHSVDARAPNKRLEQTASAALRRQLRRGVSVGTP